MRKFSLSSINPKIASLHDATPGISKGFGYLNNFLIDSTVIWSLHMDKTNVVHLIDK